MSDGLLQNIIRNAECAGEGDLRSVTNFRRSFGIMIMESTLSVRLATPASACSCGFAPSKRKGFHTTATGQNACVMRDLKR